MTKHQQTWFLRFSNFESLMKITTKELMSVICILILFKKNRFPFAWSGIVFTFGYVHPKLYAFYHSLTHSLISFYLKWFLIRQICIHNIQWHLFKRVYVCNIVVVINNYWFSWIELFIRLQWIWIFDLYHTIFYNLNWPKKNCIMKSKQSHFYYHSRIEFVLNCSVWMLIRLSPSFACQWFDFFFKFQFWIWSLLNVQQFDWMISRLFPPFWFFR